MKDEKQGHPWPDKPADENISPEPPNQFDRDETDYEPGMMPPGDKRAEGKESGQNARERGVPRRG